MTTYRYGFGGHEKSDEIKGEGNSYTAEYWEYDPRIGKRWNPDPVVNISESRYACFGNNPIYYSDPDGDFKTKFGARWHKFWHGEKGGIGQAQTGKRAGQWYISREVGAGRKGKGNGDMDEAIVRSPIYGSRQRLDEAVYNAQDWMNSVEWTSQTNLEATIGVQAGVNVKVNSLVNLKAEGGGFVNKLFDFKADAMHMERAKVSYGFEVSEDNYNLQKNFINIGIEAGIPKTALTANVGYDYVNTGKYYNGYNGPVTIDSETSKGWNGNIKLSPFKSKPTETVLSNKPSAKIGLNTEKQFYGLDVSASLRLIFGVKAQFKIGFQKR